MKSNESSSSSNQAAKLSTKNRKTQFVLGTYTTIPKTEATSNFKFHEIPQSNLAPTDKSTVKAHHFSMGHYSNDYKTTASNSFQTYTPESVKKATSAASNNIYFGGDKVKPASIGQSEFIRKVTDQVSKEEMGKVKENHRNAHFIVGSYESNYLTTNKELKAQRALSDNKRHVPDPTLHVVLGNFKPQLLTEKQESYIKQEIVKTSSENISKENKNSHLYIGKEKPVSISTSGASFQGTQPNELISHPGKDYSTNINLGSLQQKWKSSYESNYQTRSLTPYSKARPTTSSNIVLGNFVEAPKTVAQESFQTKPIEKNVVPLKESSKNDSFCLGEYKGDFITSSKRYGELKGVPSRIDKETLKKITDCHFLYGNYKADCVSKFQEDYKNPGSLPEKFDIKDNPNKKSNLSFGDKSHWDSTYSKAYRK